MLKHLFIVFSIFIFMCCPGYAQRVKNHVAVFSGLDKITGRTINFKVKIGEKYQFGTLDIIPKVCYTSVGEDPRGASVFIEVNENQRNNTSKQIFNGWMFASSPALNSIDHPIYDIWLTGCEEPS